MKPFLPNTDAIVTVRVQSAFLSAGRPLPPNPVARIRSMSDGGAVLASTQAIAFTQAPAWNEDLQFVIPAIHARTTLQLEVVDAFSGAFLGAVNALPFHVRWPQRTSQLHRLMLAPRPGNVSDSQLLRDANEDDFGHVEMAWDVQLCPIGPSPDELGGGGSSTSGALQQSSLPLSCTVRAQWIGAIAAAPTQSTSLVAHLGSSTQPVALHAETPLVALLRSEAEATIRITCRHRTATRGDEDVGVTHFVVPVRIGSAERELTWCLPITPLAPDAESSLGTIVLSLRLVPAGGVSSGMPTSSGVATLNGFAAASTLPAVGASATNPPFADRSPPNVGFGPYVAHAWEDQDHLARASERRWKKSVVADAKPRPNHVRHLLDVMAGRAELHPAIVPHLREFLNASSPAPPAASASAAGAANTGASTPIDQPQQQPFGGSGDFACGNAELRAFAIALAFACEQLTVEEAALFSMGVLCSPLGGRDRRLPSVNDAVAIFDASLLPLTLDLSTSELRRRCADLFASVAVAPGHGIDIVVFRKRFAANFGFWFVHGASQIAHRTPPQPISALATALAQQHHHSLQPYDGAAHPANLSSTMVGGVGNTGGVDDSEWLRFIIRVAKTKMGFAVTAHRDDTFAHVSAMVESTVDIPCAKHRFLLRGERVDPATAVGSLVPPGVLPQTEFVLAEATDLMALVAVWRAREKKYELRIAPHEKVLKLRAMIQQKTNIPLSRLALSYCNQQLWDRHALEHYRLCDGAIVEIDAE